MRTVLFVQISSGMGGASHSLLLLASRLPQYGYRPIIAGQQVREGLWERAEQLGIRYYPLYLTSWAKNHLSWRDLLRLPNRANTVRRTVGICVREHVSLIHTNLHFCLDGALTARLLSIPHVAHVRDEFDALYHHYVNGPRGGAIFTRRIADRVICVSRAIQRTFERAGIHDCVQVIPNAVDIPPIPAGYNERAVRASFGLPLDAPIVGLFGAIAARKGQLDFVRAMKAVLATEPTVCGIIVGSVAEPSYAVHLANEVKALDLGEHLRFIPHQPDVWPLLRAVDIVAVPSLAEGFGRIVIEGMGAAKAVVAYRTGGIAEIIEHEKTGLLLPPARSELLAEAIFRLLHDDALRTHLASHGEAHARAVYRPDTHVQKVAAVYEELLA